MLEKHCTGNWKSIIKTHKRLEYRNIWRLFMKLICLTYAGGNATFYDQLQKELSESVEVIAMEYAGHGQRHKEPFYKTFDELSRDLLRQLKEKVAVGEDYAIMGYSMGSISTVELLKRILQDPTLNNPVHIFLAAHEPATKKELKNYADNEMNETVKKRTVEFGGIPQVLVNNESFWRMYLPIYKADYTLIGTYKFEELNLKTDIPATVFFSESDTPYEKMQAWNNYFTNKCEFVQYEGNHFFIYEHYSEIAKIIENRLGI